MAALLRPAATRDSAEDNTDTTERVERRVRRWAFSLGHDHRLLTAEQLLATVRTDPDQWLRTVCADWLVPLADARQLRVLLAVDAVEARLVAITRLPDDALADEDLLPLLADRAPRVREQARWRAGRRGIDAAAWYRQQLDAPDTAPHIIAASLDGLSKAGGPGDLDALTAHLDHYSVHVRAAAVTGIATHAARDHALATLRPLLLDPSPRVSATTARALSRLNAPSSATNAAWASPQPWSRRAAWRLARDAGSWDRVEADLRAAADPDPHLASLGNAGIRAWLDTSAATTWAALTDQQQDRIRQLLATGQVAAGIGRLVAFHAGIEWPDQPPEPSPTAGGTESNEQGSQARARRWLRLVRRR